MTAYYNENDPYAAQWLRNLISAGLIAPGDVDERSIVDVRADELRGYVQCHFFAGIGGWSLALQIAGWPDDRLVWTGSCPCQPFSAAGAGKAADDERHLWPAWFSLIKECRPAIVFGEQVEAAIGWGWLDVVFSDLEAEGYACGATVLPACGIGAPHIRQRTWFVGVSDSLQPEQLARAWARPGEAEGGGARSQSAGSGDACALADAQCGAAERWRLDLARTPDGTETETRQRERVRPHVGAGSNARELGNTMRTERWSPAEGRMDVEHGPNVRWQEAASGQRLAGEVGDFWRSDWLPCTDGKARPVEPGTFPLAHGISGRVGRLRAYGNAIVPQVAAEFIAAYRECRP